MRAQRRYTDTNNTTFLFNWIPQQLSIIVLTISLVFFLNYLFVIQSIFAPNIRTVIRVRCKVRAGAKTRSDRDSEILLSSTSSTSSFSVSSAPSSSNQCQLANVHVPRIDMVADGYDGTVRSINTAAKLLPNTSIARVSTILIQFSLNSRTTATITTASVKLIDKAMPSPQLILPLVQRSIVTTNFNDDNTTISPNNIFNNTNTVLNYYYSKAKFVHRHLNRTYNINGDDDDNPIERHFKLNDTHNLTNSAFVNAFIALYTTNSDHNNKLNISYIKFSLGNDSCIRNNSKQQKQKQKPQQKQQQQHKQYCDNSDSYSEEVAAATATALVRCYR